MNYFFKVFHFSPTLDYLKVLSQYSVDLRLYPRAFLYLLKFALLEPLKYLEDILFYKKLKSLKIEKPPIFILGYYRSGTTHLQELMLSDQRFHYMNFYHCMFPTIFLLTEKLFKPLLNKMIQRTGFLHPAHKIAFHFDLPAEDDVAMVASGYHLASNWGQLFKDSFKNFFNKTVFFQNISSREQSHFEQTWKNLILKVASLYPQKQLLLKSPPNTARALMIKKHFPTAKFIYIHRNPYEVYKSNLKLWKSFEGQNLSRASQDEIIDNILWSYDLCLKKFHDDKKHIPTHDLIELSFEELQEQPFESIEMIYKKFDLEFNKFSQKQLKEYIQKTHGKNRARYKFEKTEVEHIKQHLSHWIKDYPAPNTEEVKR